MNRHLYYLNRILNKEVLNSLVLLIAESDLNNQDIENNQYFKNFVLNCFNVNRESRPSVSQLLDILAKYDCKKPGTLACLYAKKLEAMARKNLTPNFIV